LLILAYAQGTSADSRSSADIFDYYYCYDDDYNSAERIDSQAGSEASGTRRERAGHGYDAAFVHLFYSFFFCFFLVVVCYVICFVHKNLYLAHVVVKYEDVVTAKKVCTILSVKDADAFLGEISRLLGPNNYDGNYGVMGGLKFIALQEKARYGCEW
jgi:hypothetical protein